MGKRGAFTAREKLDVVLHVRRTGNIAAVVAIFFPLLSVETAVNRRKHVWAWWNEEKLAAMCATSKGAVRKSEHPMGLTATLSPQIESEIIMWINGLRKEGVPISSLMLSLRAK